MTLTFPGMQKGDVRVELLNLSKSVLISAHQGAISCMALNYDGSLLTTSSEKGTVIRVFDARTGVPLQELRRGSSDAKIYSLAFNVHSEFLAVSSSTGTVHIFRLRENNGPRQTKDARESSGFSLFNVVPKYFKSEWSFAQFKVPNCWLSVVGFGSDPHLLFGTFLLPLFSQSVLSGDGSLFSVRFDSQQGGMCTEESFNRFLS